MLAGHSAVLNFLIGRCPHCWIFGDEGSPAHMTARSCSASHPADMRCIVLCVGEVARLDAQAFVPGMGRGLECVVRIGGHPGGMHWKGVVSGGRWDDGSASSVPSCMAWSALGELDRACMALQHSNSLPAAMPSE